MAISFDVMRVGSDVTLVFFDVMYVRSDVAPISFDMTRHN